MYTRNYDSPCLLGQRKTGKKTILIITTGGTIAGNGKPGKSTNYEIGNVAGKAILEAVPGLDAQANILYLELCNLGSGDLTAEHWLDLTRIINTYSASQKVDGFVITHGTDTMEETAYWLNLTVKTEKPVVLTGAMRPGTALSADGIMNVLEAVALAASDEAVGKEVMVVMSDCIYGARSVVKSRTAALGAFTGGDMGQMGYLISGKPYIYTCSTRTHTSQTEFSTEELSTLPKVSILSFAMGEDTHLLENLARTSQGLIVAGTSAGSVSELWAEKIGSMEALGIPIVRTARGAEGPVVYNDKFDKWAHVIRGDNLTPHKAKILLQLALTRTTNPDEIRRIFARY